MTEFTWTYYAASAPDSRRQKILAGGVVYADDLLAAMELAQEKVNEQFPMRSKPNTIMVEDALQHLLTGNARVVITKTWE
jgi:hypothetical protein